MRCPNCKHDDWSKPRKIWVWGHGIWHRIVCKNCGEWSALPKLKV